MGDRRPGALHRSLTGALPLDGWDPVEHLAADVRAPRGPGDAPDGSDGSDGPNDAELAARLAVLLCSTF